MDNPLTTRIPNFYMFSVFYYLIQIIYLSYGAIRNTGQSLPIEKVISKRSFSYLGRVFIIMVLSVYLSF